jgi:glutamyl-tRNA synthetase
MSVRTRFAPSPTGYLHIGGARTALFNWLIARKVGGTFVLRIEDTDEDRNKEEAVTAIYESLRWLGIVWDEGPGVGGPYGPYRQSERFDRYRAASAKMLEAGTAYRCTCTVERLESLRAAQEARKEKPRYDGHCRNLALGPDCGPHVLRLRVPENEAVVVDDLVKGPVTYDSAELDDWILVRSDGVPTYNFVVVCDDVAMKISHVLRGDEHLNNTPKQLLVYAALNEAPPRFGHVPLILDGEGRKMSKRHGDVAVGDYKAKGILPEALVNYLARLGWSHGDLELFGVDELRSLFSIDGIGSSPSKWDPAKLLSVNAHWLKTLPPARIAEDVRPFLEARGLVPNDRLEAAVLALRERAKTLVELAEAMAFLFQADAEVVRDPVATAELLAPNSAMIGRAAEAFAAVTEWTEPALDAAGHAFCAAEGIKLGKLAQPLRVALSGQKVGPGLWQTLYVLGRETSLRRLRSAASTPGTGA